MNYGEIRLFNPDNSGEQARVPIRPLGSLSDFIIEVLPIILEEIRDERGSVMMLANVCEDLVEYLNEDGLTERITDPYLFDVAVLDVKMMAPAVAGSGGQPGPKLMSLVDKLSKVVDQPSGITYEEIILVNPTLDQRVFTGGSVGESESDFYETHRRIERHFDSVIVDMKRVENFLAGTYVAEIGVANFLRRVQSELNKVIELMKVIGEEMDPGDFSVFRQYLVGSSERKLKGPSGAFTAGVPVIELLLSAPSMSEEQISYLFDNSRYFPRKGREQIFEAVLQGLRGRSLVQLCEQMGNPDYLILGLKKISELIREFRGMHYKGVSRQVPEAISGEVSGTGGEDDPGAFLRRRMKINHVP